MTPGIRQSRCSRWEAGGGGVWVDPDGGLEDDFDDMGVASWDGGAWNDDGA